MVLVFHILQNVTLKTLPAMVAKKWYRSFNECCWTRNSKSVLRVPKYYTVRQNNVAGKVIFNQRFYAQIWHRYLQYLDLEYIAMFVSIRKVNMLHALLLSFSTKTTSILHICGGGGTEGGRMGENFTKSVKSMWSKYF